METITICEITCPECAHKEKEVMPADSCQYFYKCENCNVILKPLTGDCCVFCSYGSVPCPPVQNDRKCC
ncbi:GDCCVxC domain-containing (seleno)protein [Robertkochia aurantiaca]|uniref:GDCCVxC domain-containing (seleno)protein n=1 Tax=Robertkochia aurantiaca TaxID=2873700 RepID=UPI001CCFDB2E|nr:GDCCVxC domain-containing (seleno)protein [Robertkochia sp. 3YJGBD-33]